MKKDTNSKKSSDERRSFERIPFSVHVYFEPCGTDKNKLMKRSLPEYSYSNNISTGGIQISSHQKLQLKEYLNIQLTLPFDGNEEIISVLGQVIWLDYKSEDETYSAGISFVDLEENIRKRLKTFLASALKDI